MEVFNRALALERLEGNEDRLQDLLAAFQKSVPSVLEDLRAARDEQRTDRIENLGIELRESVRRIGAEGMEALSVQMIGAARANDLDRVDVVLSHLDMELDWLLRILDENRCSGNL